MTAVWMILLGLTGGAFGAELVPGDELRITLRGVDLTEAQEVSGDYTVSEDGTVRLPLLDSGLSARGKSAVEFARTAETAYENAGIYNKPAIEVVAMKAKQREGAFISVGGQVRSSSEVSWRKGMTVLQAVTASGGRNEFASRNVMLFRDGNQYCLDFKKLEHKNIELKQGDSLQVQQRPALLDRWQGDEAALKPLLEE